MRRGQLVRGLFAVGLVSLLAPGRARAAGLLDGKTFVGVTREAGKEGDSKERAKIDRILDQSQFEKIGKEEL